MESSEKDCCTGDCEDTMKERMNYFTGRHLAAGDFRDEQLHHRSHRFLHNRMLHGWGVVCGLEVREHSQDQCRDRFVQVSPGMAIDCCGREILVDCAICCGDEQPEIPWQEYSERRPWLMLCLAYDEHGKEKVPVLSSEGDCSTARTEVKYARYKESWQLAWHWVDKNELAKYSWKAQYADCSGYGYDDQGPNAAQQDAQAPAPGADQAANPTDTAEPVEPPPDPHPYHPQLYPSGECPHDDCDDPCGEGFRSCLATKCPPGHCVPLALICFDQARKITKVIMKGRPELPGPQRLTHIVGINWQHGGIVSPRWFRDKANNPLQVTFDRKLDDPAQSGYFPGPWGVNQATFVMQFGEGKEDLDFVDYVDAPHLSADGLKAEYEIGPRPQASAAAASAPGRSRPVYEEPGYAYLVNHTVTISLKCDFLYDCHGMRVDGNNDGIAGGTFESWFSVVSDDDYDRMYQEESQ